MDDEVSVAEILEREGWGEPDPKRNSRARMMAVLLAVVLGCGLAAMLVHFGTRSPQGDSTVLGLPHGPTGGLAGGGVPSEVVPTEVTNPSSTVVVTEETGIGGTIGGGIPWHSPTHQSSATTVTVTGDTGSGGNGGGNGGEPSLTPTNSTAPGSPSKSTANSPTTTKKNTPSCLLFVVCW